MVVLRYRGRRVHPSANEVASKVWGRPRRASSPLPVYCLRKWPRRRACGGHCAHNWKRKASSVTRWETRSAHSISNIQELASREKPVGRFVDGDLCIYCVDGHRSGRWLGSWKSFSREWLWSAHEQPHGHRWRRSRRFAMRSAGLGGYGGTIITTLVAMVGAVLLTVLTAHQPKKDFRTAVLSRLRTRNVQGFRDSAYLSACEATRRESQIGIRLKFQVLRKP
jgi:hypothetical protein